MIKIPQTIVVGLGSLGFATIEQLKARILDTYGELPAVKLLVLDVPQPGSGEAGDGETPTRETILEATEYLELPLDELQAAPERARELYPWLPERVVQLGADWRQTRAAARLAFDLHAKDLVRFIEFHLQQLSTVDVREKMEKLGFEITTENHEASLLVVAGLGDVVGSALLVDVTYFLHYLYRRAGLQIASTGVLYMPSMAPSEPAAEACAYATLKELNAYMDGRSYSHEYSKLTIECNTPPFNRGCYLVDTRNEKNLGLHSQEEATSLVAEWLYRTCFTPLKSRIDEFISGQGVNERVQDQIAAYSSLGFASYVLPVGDLIEFSANRLSYELVQEKLLKTEMFSNVAIKLSDFFNQTHLRPDDLMREELRLGQDGKPIKLQSEYIARLNSVPYDQITSQVQATVNMIGKEMLPGLKHQVENNAKRVYQDVGDVIKQEIASILTEWPAGGLSLASQFAVRLRSEATHFFEILNRREAAIQGRNQQQGNQLNQLAPMLKNAIASIPKMPILILTLVAGWFAPLLLVTLWTWQALKPVSSIYAILMTVVIWIVGLGGAVYSAWRTKSEIDAVRIRYVESLNRRFGTELDLALVQAAASLYPDIIAATDTELDRLMDFTNQLHGLTRAYKSRLDMAPLCGEIGFALQRSVLTEETIGTLYLDYVTPGLDGHLAKMIEQNGSLVACREWSSQEIEGRFLNYSRKVFEKMQELRVDSLLKDRMDTPAKTDRLVRELRDIAAPLWMYDQFTLGQTFTIVAKTFVGMDTTVDNDFRHQFMMVDQDVQFEATNDPQSLIVTSVRRGMPLFGLRRMEGFQEHYLDGVQNRGRTLHLEDDDALTQDLMPSSISQAELEYATAFAVALALGLIKPREDKMLVLTDASGKGAKELSTDRVEAAILLSTDAKRLNALTNDIQEVVSKMGVSETVQELEKYIRQQKLSNWEKDRIQRYIELLKA